VRRGSGGSGNCGSHDNYDCNWVGRAGSGDLEEDMSNQRRKSRSKIPVANCRRKG